MKITKRSVISGELHTREIDINVHQLEQMAKGKHIQWLCPQLSPEDREFLISGITPEEWNEHMGDPQ